MRPDPLVRRATRRCRGPAGRRTRRILTIHRPAGRVHRACFAGQESSAGRADSFGGFLHFVAHPLDRFAPRQKTWYYPSAVPDTIPTVAPLPPSSHPRPIPEGLATVP